jgi:hypothetical protein
LASILIVISRREYKSFLNLVRRCWGDEFYGESLR